MYIIGLRCAPACHVNGGWRLCDAKEIVACIEAACADKRPSSGLRAADRAQAMDSH